MGIRRFDFVGRGFLWHEYNLLGMKKRLLMLIQRLYSNTSCQIRFSASGNLSESIPINRGIKQGCILAPTLFNLYINDLAPFLAKRFSLRPCLTYFYIVLGIMACDKLAPALILFIYEIRYRYLFLLASRSEACDQ